MAHPSLPLHLLPLWLAVATPAVAPARPPLARAPLAITVSPAAVVGGNPTTATITLGAPAPVGGAEVTLTSTNNAVAQFGGRLAPAIGTSQLTIPAGALSAQFPVRTFGVAAPTAVTLKAAALGGTATTTLTVAPASLRTMTVTPASVIGGASATGTLTLDGAAPAGGLTVTLHATLPTATVPATVSVPAGATSTTFAIGTVPVATDTPVPIGAAVAEPGGVASIASSLARSAVTVLAPTPSALQLLPSSVVGGAAVTARVVLTGAAPRGGIAFALSASSVAVRVPSSVTVPAGADRQDVTVSTVPVPNAQTVTLRVRRLVAGIPTSIADGSSNTITVGESTAPPGSASATLTLAPPPPPVVTVSALPSPTIGGVPVTLTVTVEPNGGTTGAASTVSLSTNHPELLQLPASVPFPAVLGAGPQTATVTSPTLPAAEDQTVTITARVGTGTGTTTLLVKQTPPPIASFTLRPSSVHGGANSIASIATASTLTSAVTVTLTTDHPELVSLPAPFLLSPSLVPRTLTLKTSPTTAPVTVTITATAGAQRTSATMNVIP